jgi:signal transduction histidine kinase
VSISKWLLVVLPVLGAPPPPAIAAQTPKSVLIVFSHERERWLYDALESRLRGEIETMGSGINIYTEYLDAMRFADDEFRDHTVEYFRAKYADRQVSVIVPVSPLALDFVLDHRAQFFPDTPIVFASVNRSRMDEWARLPNFTGVAVSRELTSTLDLALTVQPDTQSVYIPAGTTQLERTWTEGTRRSLQPFERRVKLEFLVGLSMNDLEDRLAHLPPHSIVLNAGLMYYDADGQYFLPEEIVRQICRVSNAPVYSTGEPELGLGIVGGSLYDMAPVGAAAGAMVRRILKGEPASRIPIEVLNPNGNVFDARQLERWGIDERRLPADAIVRFRPPSLWRDYRGTVIGAVAFASLQALLIASLIAEYYRRRQAERQSRADLAALAQLDRRGAMDQLTGTIAHQLFQPLGAILHNAEAGKKMIVRGLSPPNGELAEIFDDIAKDEKRAAEIIQRMRMLLQKHELETQPTDLNEIALETTELLAPDARSRSVQVESEIADRACIVMGDRIHLQQVVLNLMLNGFDAVAAMPAERRRVVVRTQASDGMAIVSVADKGPGISADVLPRLFDPLFTTKSHGTGIGLSIARTIIAAHGGDIGVENNPPAGATFRFSIPLAKPG